MSKIKVCHFATVHTTTDTRVFHRECVSLAQWYDVTYIGIGSQSGIVNGVNIIAIPKPQSRIYRLLILTWIVFLKAAKQRAQIYHIHDAELIPFAFILSLMGKKVIYDIHENTYEDILHKPWIPQYLKWGLGKLYRALEWVAAQSMDIILVIAKPEFAKRFIHKKYAIIQNFADTDLLKLYVNLKRNEIAEPTLFYMGMINDYYYNMIPVFKALALLKKKGIIVQLHCVGYIDKQIKSLWEQESAFNEIKNQLHFYGYKSVDEGFEISKQCKIGLCLKNQPEEILVSHERKFFEYMAIGLPTISCDSHIYKEIIEHYQFGVYTNIIDSNSLALSIETLLKNDLNSLAENGVNASKEKYNWVSQQVLLKNLYEELSTEITTT